MSHNNIHIKEKIIHEQQYQLVLQRLREERERRYLIQRRLCCCIKMPQNHYGKTETGHRQFSWQELKELCTSDIDVYYVFTGKKPVSWPDFPAPPEPGSNGITCYLATIYILAVSPMYQDRASFEKIREELAYIQCGNGNSRAQDNIFYYMRNRCGYSQKKMADTLGINIKKLRALEKGKQLPDSGTIWKMYDCFRVSPAFLLGDPKGLQSELNYVLGLLEADERETVLRILEQEQQLIRRVKH